MVCVGAESSVEPRPVEHGARGAGGGSSSSATARGAWQRDRATGSQIPAFALAVEHEVNQPTVVHASEEAATTSDRLRESPWVAIETLRWPGQARRAHGTAERVIHEQDEADLHRRGGHGQATQGGEPGGDLRWGVTRT